MLFYQKRIPQRLLMGFTALFCIVFLTACGGSSGNTAVSTPTAPAATPTPALSIYTGTGFTIGYPQDWKVQNASGAVTITDSTGQNSVTILLVPNPGGSKSASDIADASLATFEQASVKNAQPVTGLAPTATVDGEAWTQRGTTGTISSNGQNFSGEVILLVDNHPANAATTQAYEIYYGGFAMTFQQENILFQSMLQSFKFTS